MAKQDVPLSPLSIKINANDYVVSSASYRFCFYYSFAVATAAAAAAAVVPIPHAATAAGTAAGTEAGTAGAVPAPARCSHNEEKCF